MKNIVVILFSALAAFPARAESIFDFGPKNRIGAALSGDSQDGSAASLEATAVLPNEWTVSAVARTRRIEIEGEESVSRNLLLAVSSDPFANWVFDASADREAQEDLFTDFGIAGRATWQPVSGWLGGWALWLGAGARTFTFTKTAVFFAPKSQIDVYSSSVRVGFDGPLGRSLNVSFEGEKYKYPDEIVEYDRDIVALLVPFDTLSYAFALPESSARAQISWSLPILKRQKPVLAVAFTGSRSAVDQSELGSIGIDIGFKIYGGWRALVQSAATRTLSASENTTESESVLKSFGLGISYEWR